MENGDGKKPIPSISVESRLVYDRLNKAAVGEIVTYEELTKLMGRDAQKQGSGIVRAVRDRLERNEQKVFEAVQNVGVKRANDVEAIDAGESRLRRSRRQIKRGMRKLACVQNFDGLSNEDKVRHNTTMSMMGVLVHLTDAKQVKRLSAVVKEAQTALPSKNVLEHMKGV